MSTDSPTPPVSDSPGAPTTPSKPENEELVIYSHSNLYYWWPVWAFGFIFALWSFAQENRMLIVPKDSVISWKSESNWMVDIKFEDKTDEEQADYINRDTHGVEGEDDKNRTPQLHVSRQARMAPIYFLIILLTIIITNVPLRGLWSVIAIGGIVLVAIIFALVDAWDWIFRTVGNLHVYVNMGGYLFMASVVFVVWALATFIFDKRTYIKFRPGQVKIREEIGGRETTYPTLGMTSEKHRDDIFRHIVLGWGSGDLTVKPSNGPEHKIQNVLFIGGKLRKAQEMLAQISAGQR